MVGRKAGKPFSPYFYQSRWKKSEGQYDAAKNGEIAIPLIPLQFSVPPLQFLKQSRGFYHHQSRVTRLDGRATGERRLDIGEPSKSNAYAAFPHGLRNTPIVICDEYANVRQNLVGLHGI